MYLCQFFQMKPDVEIFFTDPMDTLRKQYKKLLQVKYCGFVKYMDDTFPAVCAWMISQEWYIIYNFNNQMNTHMRTSTSTFWWEFQFLPNIITCITSFFILIILYMFSFKKRRHWFKLYAYIIMIGTYSSTPHFLTTAFPKKILKWVHG